MQSSTSCSWMVRYTHVHVHVHLYVYTVCAKKNFPYHRSCTPFIWYRPNRCATVVISTVQRSFQQCNGRTQYERCFTENHGGVTILASALSLDQLSSAGVSASWQRLLPTTRTKRGGYCGREAICGRRAFRACLSDMFQLWQLKLERH